MKDKASGKRFAKSYTTTNQSSSSSNRNSTTTMNKMSKLEILQTARQQEIESLRKEVVKRAPARGTVLRVGNVESALKRKEKKSISKRIKTKNIDEEDEEEEEEDGYEEEEEEIT